ncbi:hypothetical protein YC2023_042463 [Brassica napus]
MRKENKKIDRNWSKTSNIKSRVKVYAICTIQSKLQRISLSNASSLSTRSFYGGLSHRHVNRQSFFTVHHSIKSKSVNLAVAVHTVESSRNAVSLKDSVSPPGALKWTLES